MTEPKFPPPMPSFVPGNAACAPTTLGTIYTGMSRYEPPVDWKARANELESTLAELLALVECDEEANDTTTDLYVAVMRAKFILGRDTSPTGGEDA